MTALHKSYARSRPPSHDTLAIVPARWLANPQGESEPKPLDARQTAFHHDHAAIAAYCLQTHVRRIVMINLGKVSAETRSAKPNVPPSDPANGLGFPI